MGDSVYITAGVFRLEDFYEAIFGRKKIAVDESVYKKLDEIRSKLEEKVLREDIIYGINTGLGALANKILDKNQLDTFQRNIIRSHSAGVGEIVEPEIARGALLLRIVALSKGYSGIRSELLKLMVAFFNSGAVPLIPSRGSVGASGDLAPLSHLALALVGDEGGGLIYKGVIYRNKKLKEVLEKKIYKDLIEKKEISSLISKVDFPLIKLSFKEALALSNGTSFSASIVLYVIYKLEKLMKVADANAALILEALSGFKDAFSERFFEKGDVRYIHPAIETITTVKGILEEESGSKLVRTRNDTFKLKDIAELNWEDNEIVLRFDELKVLEMGIKEKIDVLLNLLTKKLGCDSWYVNGRRMTYHLKCRSNVLEKAKNLQASYKELGIIQDAYSLRCTPQIHGAARRALEFAKTIMLDEINIPNDNPLVFEREEGGIEIVSGGNFHGQSVALAAENLALAIAYIANISERRIFRLLDPSLNKGLPPFLATSPGLESGMMLAQYTAAELVAEIRQLSSPPSVHSIPTSANQEDVVSMSTTSAVRLLRMLDSLEYILAIEQLLALQGIALRLGWPKNREGFEKASKLARDLIDFYNKVFSEIGGFPIKGDRVLNRYFELAKRKIYEVQEEFI